MSTLRLSLLILALAHLFAFAAPAYPLKKSANNRYLVDQNNVPFLIVGDSPQALIVNLTEAEAASFFSDRAALGFNTMWVNLLCATYTGGRADASTIDNIKPFTANISGTRRPLQEFHQHHLDERSRFPHQPPSNIFA